MAKTLIIIRGLPGAGKSLFAKTMGSPVISADDYFMVNGKYVFEPEKLGKAHLWCQNTTKNYMEDGQEHIFVANTFTTESEMTPYYELAKKYDYIVFSVIVENRHSGVSVHNVPDNAIIAMKNRFNIKL